MILKLSSMASLIQKLVRSQSLSKTLIADLNTRILSSPTRLLDPKTEPPVDPIPFFNNILKTTDELNPILIRQLFTLVTRFRSSYIRFLELGVFRSVLTEEDVDSIDGERGIWADKTQVKEAEKASAKEDIDVLEGLYPQVKDVTIVASGILY